MGCVYLIRIIDTDKYKIGFTTKGVNVRIKQLQVANPDELIYVNKFKCKYYNKLESYLHNFYKNKQIDGEWFLLNEDDVTNFIPNCEKLHHNITTLLTENPFFN